MRALPAILTLAVLVSCGPKKSTPQSASAESESTESENIESSATTPLPAETAPSVKQKMQTHYALIERARQAVVAGDVSSVRAAGAALNFLNPTNEELPEPWKPYLADMKVTALQVETVEETDEAAKIVSQLAVTCSRCHAGLEAGDVIPEAVEKSSGGPAVMRRHDDAVQTMWRGLIRGDDAEFSEGAEALTKSPFFDPESPRAAEEPFVALAGDVKTHAEEATEAEADEDRVAAMSEILADCVRCHEAAGAVE